LGKNKPISLIAIIDIWQAFNSWLQKIKFVKTAQIGTMNSYIKNHLKHIAFFGIILDVEHIL